MKLLEFMRAADEECQKEASREAIAKIAIIAGGLIIVGGIVCIVTSCGVGVPEGLTLIALGAGIASPGAVMMVEGFDFDEDESSKDMYRKSHNSGYSTGAAYCKYLTKQLQSLI